MSLYMANIRMRRVEKIEKHPSRFDPGRRSNCYMGTRMWVLLDTQVFTSYEDALAALVADMKAIWEDRDARQTKLLDAINSANSEYQSLLHEELICCS
ncbi:hypothetical protein D3C76_407120 [compost metagenome]